MKNLLLAAAIAAAVLAAGATKISDLDFWWHLKTGQLIVATHSIPRTDVYSYTAFGHEYIDHEWLFQVSQYATWVAFGPAGIALLKCVVFASTLIIVAFYIVGRGVDPLVAGGLVFLSIAGGISRLIERPEMFSTLFAVLTYICADSYLRTRNWRWLIPLPLLCALWANVHAAVIVGLVIQLLLVRSIPQLAAFAGSVLASGLNPFGYRVLTVPFELTRIIDSGILDNQEWRRPTPTMVPFYFVALALTVVFLVAQTLLSARRRQAGVPVAQVPVAQILVAVFLAYTSLKYVRNVSLFSVFMPLLVADEAARLSRVLRNALAALGLVALAIALTLYFPFQRGFGEASYFPRDLVRVIRARNLRGHMLNSYGFGGYLIWNFYPERRVFIDGRNEVYLPLLERLHVAVNDNRSWSALLRDYSIEYAVMHYVDDLERVTTLDAQGRSRTAYAPFSATRFPRARWALVDWDDVGMIFVRRGGMNPVAGEYFAVFPEGHGYQRELVRTGVVDRNRAIAELRRKLAEDPESIRARQLLRDVQNR